MPDDALPTQTSDPSLDDLERRLSSFETATKRLGRTVGGLADPDTAAPGHASPPRPATRRLSESVAPRGEEISGLRPAVQVQGPQTGALTARHSNAPHPVGFTSAHGRPNIPAPVAAAASGPSTAIPTVVTTRSRNQEQPRRKPVWLATPVVAGLALALLLLIALSRAFPELPNAVVLAPNITLAAPANGTLVSLLVQVGDRVAAGQELARFSGGQVLTADTPRIVARLMSTAGSRLAAGEPIVELAELDGLGVAVPLKSADQAQVGDRVRVRLLGERRSVDGTVSQILPAGQPGWWRDEGSPPLRAVIDPDPGPAPPRLGQGARVVIVGSNARVFLLELREMLPW